MQNNQSNSTIRQSKKAYLLVVFACAICSCFGPYGSLIAPPFSPRQSDFRQPIFDSFVAIYPNGFRWPTATVKLCWEVDPNGGCRATPAAR